MNDSPEHLEKIIHQALRSLPARRAPHTLESRVLAAIEARAALPWWHQSYAQWPLAARCVFLVVSAALAKVALMAAVWIVGDFDTPAFVNAFATPFGWIEQLNAAFTGLGNFFALIMRNVPATWLYGSLACLGLLYAALFGLGATAYRTLFSSR